jgi:hypothetical protein
MLTARCAAEKWKLKPGIVDPEAGSWTLEPED